MITGWFKTPNGIFEKDLSRSEKLIYVYLCRCSNNTAAFPSYNTIARMCGCTRRTAIRTVNHLENLELITVERYQNKPNLYHIASA